MGVAGFAQARQGQPAAGVGGVHPVQRPAGPFVWRGGCGQAAVFIGCQGVAAGHADGLCAHVEQAAGVARGGGHVARAVWAAFAAQAGGFGGVGGDERGAGHEQLAIGAQHGVTGKGRAGAGAEHGVDHQGHGRALAQGIYPAGHGLHVFHAAQQAGFDGGGRHVACQRGQLGLQLLRRQGGDAGNGLRVLRRDGGHHRAQVHAESERRALVGCQARAAAAVVAGDAPENGFAGGFVAGFVAGFVGGFAIRFAARFMCGFSHGRAS